MTTENANGTLRDRLRAALPTAMKARDAHAVAALRSALAALENAEAIAPAARPSSSSTSGPIAGAARGLGASEAPRRTIGNREALELVRGEIRERLDTAAAIALTHPDRAATLRAEAAALEPFLDD